MKDLVVVGRLLVMNVVVLRLLSMMFSLWWLMGLLVGSV